MDDIAPLVCPDCGVLMREGRDAFECPACGHRIAYDATEHPTGTDDLPGIHGG